MYGDFLVPENTNVNNAITTNTGAKWEEIFSETRETTGNVGYEFPTDIDGTPLNLNGVMIIIGKSTAISTSNSTITMNINGETIVNSTMLIGNDTKFMAKCQLKNGLLDSKFVRAVTSNSTQAPSYSFNGVYKFYDNITSFTFSAQHIESGSTVRIFVLRGV